MTKLTTERLEKFVNDIKTDGMCDITDSQVESALIRLLAYEQAAKNPVAWYHTKLSKGCGMTNPLYAEPVLPKQPELIGMKVSIDTGSDNIGHRLFGEIVGTSDSKGVPVLCIEVAENNDDMAAPAQPVALIFENHAFTQLYKLEEIEIAKRTQKEAGGTITELFKGMPAQPVSEPYKLEIDMDDADHFSITRLHEIIYGKELIWPEAKLLARFMLDVKQRASASPAQDDKSASAELPNHSNLSTNSPVIPDGWKLVPIEPTPKMRVSGKHAMKGCESIFEGVIAEVVYGAMVNAAPAQESE